MPDLKRERRRYRDRRVVFTHWPEGGLEALLATTLGPTTTDVVYVVGPALGVDKLRALIGAEPGLGWSAGSHYATLPSPVLRYTHAPTGHRVEIHQAASYFGSSSYSPADAFAAWNLLGALVRASFDEGRLLGTPAATGRYLLLRSIPHDRRWGVLEAETQDFIRATTGQGRIQLFGREGCAPLVQYDARLAYGAHAVCSALPCGEPARDTTDRFLGWHKPARYLVRAIVPRRWARECECGAPGHKGIGILPSFTGDRWEWPSGPGETLVSWVDAREVAIALGHGWRVQILERMVFPQPPYPAVARRGGQVTKRGPLDAWAAKLVALRRLPRPGEPDAMIGALVNVALRAILLYGIGALHGAPRRVTRTVSAEEARAGAIPDTATDVLPLGDRFVWTETEPVAWPEMSHPEWTAAIWARARAALLDNPTPYKGPHAGMLHVPATSVVACFTDSIYLTADPEWVDDGNAGRYRRVWADPVADALPANAAQLRARKARAS